MEKLFDFAYNESKQVDLPSIIVDDLSGDVSEAEEIKPLPVAMWREVSIVLSNRDEFRMIIPMKVSGRNVKALIDTGATQSMINWAWLNQQEI